MGCEPWWYTVKYNRDISDALEALQEREFRAGRYNPVMPHIDFPITNASPAPGAQHASIDEAREAADADGTRSILDIAGVSEERDFGYMGPLEEDRMLEFFGSRQPARKDVEKMKWAEELGRFESFYVVVYRDGTPDELFFAGISAD